MARSRQDPRGDPTAPLLALERDLEELRREVGAAYHRIARQRGGTRAAIGRVIGQARKLRRGLAARRTSTASADLAVPALLEALLHRLDLATREDVQRLEERLAAIERRLAQADAGPATRRPTARRPRKK